MVLETNCNNAKKRERRNSYLLFYKTNLMNRRTIIRNIIGVQQEIIQYLNLKIAESESNFAE